MGYMHIDNLYKNQDILLFKECYVLEKIHGTSAHINFKDNQVIFFSGGEKHNRFIQLFDKEKLLEKYKEKFMNDVTIFGEAYGGSQQGMSETYGKELKFVAFDVKIGEAWLSVPDAEDVTKHFGLEFVAYAKVNANIETLDTYKTSSSVQATRNGIDDFKEREGIVLRPLMECRDNRGNRIMSKHKNDTFRETKTPRPVDPGKLKVLEDAKEIADEWVTAERLNHVLDKLPPETNITETKQVIAAMTEDIFREGKDEIVDSREAKTAIGKATAIMFKTYLQKRLN